MLKSKSGKVAKLFNRVLGVLAVGDGIEVLDTDSWFFISSKAATASVLPFKAGYMFKTGGATLTPIVGDDVYPVTFDQICKVDTSISGAKGTIDTTDDCSEGYNQMITDGFTDLSGSASGFFKLDDIDGSMAATQKEYLGKFFSMQDDDGAGVYNLTEIDDTNIFLAILMNSDQTDVGMKQQWLFVPAILNSTTMDKPLKAAQPFDFGWAKGEGAASIYTRVTNGTETVL